MPLAYREVIMKKSHVSFKHKNVGNNYLKICSGKAKKRKDLSIKVFF
jgi:hypothetical protein